MKIVFKMLATISNALRIINTIEPDAAELAVAVLNEVGNPVLAYGLS